MALQAVFRGPGLGFFVVTRRAACDEAHLWQEVGKGRGQRKAGSRDPGDGRGRIGMARVCVSFCGDVVKYPLVQIVFDS